ncbi:MAG: hypothetical protein ACLVHY_01110 [Gemmiger sp.]
MQWQDPATSPTQASSTCCGLGRRRYADLSRPISVNDFDNQTGALTFLYQLKGEGTHKLPPCSPVRR